MSGKVIEGRVSHAIDIPPSKAPIVSVSKNLYPHCLVVVGSRNRFEGDFTIALK